MFPENLNASTDTSPRKHDVLIPISSCVTSIAQATDVDSLLEPLARTLMQLYKPSAIEILLRTPNSSQLVPNLILRTNGTQDQLFPPPYVNPVAQAALQRGKIIAMPSPQDDNAALVGVNHLVGFPIGKKIPEGVIVLGFPDAPPDFNSDDSSISILTPF